MCSALRKYFLNDTFDQLGLLLKHGAIVSHTKRLVWLKIGKTQKFKSDTKTKRNVSGMSKKQHQPQRQEASVLVSICEAI